MLRTLAIMATLSLPVAAQAQADVAALSDAMRIPHIAQIMRDEGIEAGVQLQDELFPDQASTTWQATLERIYDPQRAADEFSAALEGELAANDVAAVSQFVMSDLGQRIVTLEVEARRAMLDEAAEDAARLQLEEMTDAQAPRLEALREFVEVNDLVEMNVAGALNTNLAFYQGLYASGALADMPEDEMLADVWAQEPTIRTEVEGWIYPYLALAYTPMPDEDLAEYIAFSASPEGQRFNTAVFNAFDAVFARVSRDVGEAAGLQMQGENL